MLQVCRRRLHFASLAYASTTFAATLIDSIFKFYYVKVFLMKYHVSNYWFNVAQVVFMIWNAVNDPLFGYIQDNSTSSIFRIRRKSILYGAPLFVFSFLTFWFPWSGQDSPAIVGLHLVFSLCFYDALFTFVLLAQCALFAEMSTEHDDRLRLVLYSQVASLLASWSVGACEFSSSSLADFPSFQLAAVFFACLSWVGFSITGKFAKTEVAQLKPKEKTSPEIKGSGNSCSDALCLSSSSSSSPTSLLAFLRQTLEILRQPNFLAFVLANFLQIFHVTFYSNFASIFLDILFPGAVDGVRPSFVSSSSRPHSLSPSARSFFHGSLFVVPQILVICLGPFLRAKGAFWVVIRSFVGKIIISGAIGLSLTLSLLSPENLRVALLFFIGADFSCGSAIFATFNLLVSDIIDDDMRLHKRTSPLSSSVFGTNALITKPAQSLAPMLVLYLLNPYAFQEFKRDPRSFAAADDGRLVALQYATLTLLWAWPFFLGIFQVLVFSRYNLRNTHQNIVAKHVEN